MAKPKIDIPEWGTGTRLVRNGGTSAKLRNMKVGEKTKLPRRAWSTLHQCANQAGIGIVTRSLGCKKTVTVWRVS